jgi:chromosome segregation ATPase
VQLLGRAEDVSSYVRRGTQEGEVTITLAGKVRGTVRVIKRKIAAKENSSSWLIDGKAAKHKDVQQVTSEFGIHLDNLCQFLPQDKVVEFAAMNPVELLRATEAAVGDDGLLESHDKLIELSKHLDREQVKANQMSDDLSRLKEENGRSERHVERLLERERLLEEAERLKQKIPWAEYARAKFDHNVEINRFNSVKSRLKASEESNNRDDQPVLAKKAALEDAMVREKAITKRVRELERKATSLADECEAAYEDAAEKQKEYDGIQEKSDARRKRIEDARNEFETAKKEAEDASKRADEIVPGAAADQTRAEARVKDLSTQEVVIDNEMEEYRTEEADAESTAKTLRSRLERSSEARRRRLLALEDRFHGISKAAKWVQDNKSRFRGQVLGPIGAEIECPDHVHAAMLENAVSFGFWAHFVVEYEEDQDLLRKELQSHFENLANNGYTTNNYNKNRQGFRPTISLYRGNPSEPLRHPLGRGTEYAKFGVTSTLDETFQAPPLIKRVLNDNFNLTKTFVMREGGDWEGLFAQKPEIWNIYITDSKISRSTSRYNKEAVSTTIAPLTPASLLIARDGSRPEEEAGLMEELSKVMQAIQAAKKKREDLQPEKDRIKAAKEKAMQEVGSAKTKVQEAQKKAREAKVRVTAKENALNRAEATEDPASKRDVLLDQATVARNTAMAKTMDAIVAYEAWTAETPKHAAVQLTVKELESQIRAMEREAASRKEELRKFKGLVQTYERNLKELEKKALVALEAARVACPPSRLPQSIDQDVCRGCAKRWNDEETVLNLTPEQKALCVLGLCGPAPDHPDVLKERLRATLDEAESFVIADPAALDLYRQRCSDIADKERQLETVKKEIEVVTAEIAQVREGWLPRLKEIVDTIHGTFSAIFPRVGIAGEVTLCEGSEEGGTGDYSKYAIEIRVRFRESEEMMRLNANRQSGGERSVSTILYLVALQRVASAPFRVVDEINQGMDPQNERAVFRLLVAASVTPDTPQCFLLTPKLLPDLPFSKEVTVLHIMNGVHIEKVARGFNNTKLLGNAAAKASKALAVAS